jgi:hypothetical protein
LEGDIFDEVINGYHIFRHNGGKGNTTSEELPSYYLHATMKDGKLPEQGPR